MDVLNEMCDLLVEQEKLFLSYETETAALLECEPEDAQQHIDKRQKLADKIDILNERMEKICAQQPNGSVLLKVAKARCNFEDVAKEYEPVFYAGQAVRTVHARVMEKNEAAIKRMKEMRATALSNVRSSQNVSKIKRYVGNLTDGNGEQSRMKSKI